MDNTEMFFKSDRYFLVDIFNGKPKISNINIKKVMNSKYNLNNRMEVKVVSNSKITDPATGNEQFIPLESSGFINTSEFEYMDDLDIINSEIATLMGINGSKIFKLVSQENIKGTINISVIPNGSQLVTFDFITKESIRRIKDAGEKIPKWLNDYANLPATKSDAPIMDLNEAGAAIELPLKTCDYFFDASTYDEDKMIRSYVSMLIFDYITNQSIRNLSNYGVLYDNKSKDISFAPIYDFNNSLNVLNNVKINNKYIDKDILVQYLFINYYQYFKDITRGLAENLDAYKKSIRLIVENNTAKEYVDAILSIIDSNLDKIVNYENERRADSGESRIDIVLTQTSINLNAVNRNQEVRNKYETNDSYTEKVNTNEELEKQLLKITVEKDAIAERNRVVFKIFMFIVFMILVGFGIVFYMFYLKNY